MDSKLMIDWLDDHGCSNHGCVVRWSKRTVGTNAICSCMRDTPYYERDRVLQYHKRLRDERIAELEQLLDTALDQCKQHADVYEKRISELEAQLAAVRAVLDATENENYWQHNIRSRIREAIAGEQKHHPDCTVFAGPPYGDVCTCGLDTGEQE